MMRAWTVVIAAILLLGCPSPTGTDGGTGGGGGFPFGGGTATGGGTGAGGGTATGGGAGGGEQGGTVTIEELGFVEPAIVSGADGVLHLVFTSGPTPDSSFGYARCASNCGVGSSWTVTLIDTGAPLKNRSRLVIGSDNRLH